MATWYIDSNGNKHLISGMVTGELPKYTMAEYTALTDKPIDWICTDYDATSEYGINATEVKYDSNNSVKDKIDEVDDKTFAEMSSIGISDVNDLPNGIFYNENVGISNMPSNNRFLIISVQLLDNPVRKLQWAYGLDGSAYQRFKQGDTWTNWQLKIVAN